MFPIFIENAIIVLKAAANDEGFKLPMSQASTALKLSEKLLEENKESPNKEELSCWSSVIVAALKKCILNHTFVESATDGSSATHQFLTKITREEMWSNYHKLICSSSFRDNWIGVLGQSCPTLSQFLLRKMFNNLVLLLSPLFSKGTIIAAQPELHLRRMLWDMQLGMWCMLYMQNKVMKGKIQCEKQCWMASQICHQVELFNLKTQLYIWLLSIRGE